MNYKKRNSATLFIELDELILIRSILEEWKGLLDMKTIHYQK